MSKHTPGPWSSSKVTVNGIQHRGFYIFHDNKHIASCHESADARVIAAAPEMYEALKHMVAAVSGALVLLDMPGDIRQNYLVIVAEAEVILAKAEGRQS